MKNKKIILAFAAIFTASAVSAKTVSPAEALDRLNSSVKASTKFKTKSDLRLVHTAFTQEGAPAVYVFNNDASDNGYLLLSADDSALPLLGYSDKGSFSADEMPPQMEWWLEEYGRQIQYAASRADESVDAPLPTPKREAIEPLIKSQWDQGAPYNGKTPTYGLEHTWTGCAATSMAQVINYWEYPKRGKGEIQYTSQLLQKRLTLNFANQRFDYDKMLDVYAPNCYTDEEGDAVATLMRACGYATRMNYSTDASATLAMYIGDALVKYFDYDPGIRYELRLYYSASEWEEMIYDNLKNVGPIVYGGNSMLGGGHSFVCDGYDGNGLFHFNWGWSGMSDGYFSLQAINPASLGTGGGTGGGFNFAQDAVLGIRPPTGESATKQPKCLTQMGSLIGSIEDNVLKLTLDYEQEASWVSYNPTTGDYAFMAKVTKQGEDAAEEFVPIGANTKYNIPSGYGISSELLAAEIPLDKVCKTDGAYKITVGTVLNGTSTADWLEAAPAFGYYNYVVLRRQGNSFSVENCPVAELTLVDATISDPLYYNCLVTTSVTLRNDTDIELTKGFAPLLEFDDNGTAYEFFLGKSMYISVPPHQEVTKEWVTDLSVLQLISGVSSDFPLNFTMFDESTYKRYKKEVYKPVVMKANPGTPRVILNNFKIENAEMVNESLGLANANVFVVNDKMDINIVGDMKLRFNSAPFMYTAVACVTQPDFTTSDPQEFSMITYVGEDVMMNRSNNSHNFSAKLQLPQAEPGVHYAIVLGYMVGGVLKTFETEYIYLRYDPEANGIDSVVTDTAISDNKIYNLQGVCLGTDWESVPKGIYIVNGKKRAKY